MSLGRGVRIGLETDFLNDAMTGVGNYCFQLLSALTEYDQTLQFSGFSRMTWKPFGQHQLRQIDRMHGKSELGSDALTAERSRAQQFRSSMRAAASNVDLVRRVYQDIRLRKFRQIGELDLFHAFKYLPPVDLAVPVLPVVYDLSFVRFPETHPRQRLKELERLPDVVSRAPFVQTISEFSKAEIADVYGFPRERIVVAPPAASRLFRPLGLDISQAHISSFNLTAGCYFLAVGTLEPRKNLPTLIAAYSKLPSKARNRSPLVIAGGKGWGQLALPSSADHMVRDGSLRFLGAVPDTTLRSLYEGARALLFPSIYEGFGMPAIEALACGTEVVHSSGTSMDEITAGAARTVPAMDVSAWAAVLQDLSDNLAQGTKDRHLRIAQSHRFSWRHTAEVIGQLYRTMDLTCLELDAR